MKERPILMNAFSVNAILEGRKTQTRRVIKPQPLAKVTDASLWADGFWRINHRAVKRGDDIGHYTGIVVRCPHGKPGDRLWVRETWAPLQDVELCQREGEPIDVAYRADDGWCEDNARELLNEDRWRPSIFMPRWASRITLEVTGVRVERVQMITVADCYAEGIQHSAGYQSFVDLWDSINAKRGYGWDQNPWVWVVEFKQAN